MLIRNFRLGPLELATNLFLAPLAGYTSLAFRIVVREMGGVGLATTEVVSAKSLANRSRRTIEFLRSAPADRPLAIQLNASSPEEGRDAALVAESLGAAAIDINMGCPVRKVARKGGGAALARSADDAAAVVRAIGAAVRVPVTAKMRLGWAEGDLTAPDVARALEQAGVAAVSVHGRRRSQGFAGAVDRAGIAAVVRAVPRLPVIGNGDVTSPRAASAMLLETGCAGLSIGRAAVANPWIFRDVAAFLETGEEPPPPSHEERLSAIARHFQLLTRDEGEKLACLQLRKVLRLHGSAFGGGAAIHDEAARVATAGDVAALLERLRVLSADRPPLQLADSVPVPKGPVDLW